jgi:hypothetical protein
VRRLGLVLAVAMSITTVGAAAGGRPQNADLSLRGTVSVRDFVVPRGTTKTISGDLRVLASREIVVDGTLLVRVPPTSR